MEKACADDSDYGNSPVTIYTLRDQFYTPSIIRETFEASEGFVDRNESDLWRNNRGTSEASEGIVDRDEIDLVIDLRDFKRSSTSSSAPWPTLYIDRMSVDAFEISEGFVDWDDNDPMSPRNFIRDATLARRCRAGRATDDELSDRLSVKLQSDRCIDRGLSFCQPDTGCPISNIIPKWIELVNLGSRTITKGTSDSRYFAGTITGKPDSIIYIKAGVNTFERDYDQWKTLALATTMAPAKVL
ncbi:glutamate synthase Glt1 [Aspergillus luchuensis]|uniref:Glutamate synthase Glt1 n=1 Tax=Aspergillus kawachii TaxID=1069201 RepID=A0A146FV33_ASPKA|nr:glutamate synthase Glt1 [Aspergillus luchuensis]